MSVALQATAGSPARSCVLAKKVGPSAGVSTSHTDERKRGGHKGSDVITSNPSHSVRRVELSPTRDTALPAFLT